MSDYVYPININNDEVTLTQNYNPPEHYGVDWSAPLGTTIFAANSGTVVTRLLNAQSGSGYGGYGNVIQIQHADGMYTLYAHCYTLDVALNANVYRGQPIATVGNSGDSTGNHLHFEISPDLLPTTHTQEDPFEYLDGASVPTEEPADWIYGNRALTEEEMQNNALKVIAFFSRQGWTFNSICGMLGNMVVESTINPGRWEGGVEYQGGYGLVQWTPYTNYSNWAGDNWENNGDLQCSRIQFELENGLQYYATNDYDLTFREFSESTEDVKYLASAFLYNYERPADPQATESTRQEWAEYFYNLYNGSYPSYTQDSVKKTQWKGAGMDIFKYILKRRR